MKSILDSDQKLYLLLLRTSVLLQLLLMTKERKEIANRITTNTVKMIALTVNRGSKKRKRDEIEQDIKESISYQLE
jgi:hypothetical protein